MAKKTLETLLSSDWWRKTFTSVAKKGKLAPNPNFGGRSQLMFRTQKTFVSQIPIVTKKIRQIRKKKIRLILQKSV